MNITIPDTRSFDERFDSDIWPPKAREVFRALTKEELDRLFFVCDAMFSGESQTYCRALASCVLCKLENWLKGLYGFEAKLDHKKCLRHVIVGDTILRELGFEPRLTFSQKLPTWLYAYENIELCNEANERWTERLASANRRSRRKREFKRKARAFSEQDFDTLSYELLPFVYPPSPVKPAFKVDWVREKHKRMANKLKRRLRWLLYLERCEEEKFEDACSDAAQLWAVELQAGTRLEARAVRDEQQRKAAVDRERKQYKAVPKKERLKAVKQARDKRNPALQSGKFVAAASVAAVGITLKKVLSLLHKTDKVVDTLQFLLDKLRDLGENMKKHLGKALWYVPIVMTIFYAVRKLTGAPPLLVGVVLAALAKLIGPKVWNHISKFFPDGDVGYQSGDTSSFFDAAPKLLASLFAFSVLGNKRPSSTSEFCKRISMLERMSGGWEVFLKWLMTSLEVLVNYVRKAFGKPRITLFKNAHTPTYEWAREVDNVCLIEATGGKVSAEHLDHMSDLIRRGFEYKTLYRGLPLAKFVDDYVIKICNAMMPYQGALNARNNFRAEPAILMLHGQPGIGKTLMAMHLCAAVILESKLQKGDGGFEDVLKQVWQKGASQYWNGYAGQTCLVIDDAFQKRANLSDEENDYMTIIRAGSSWAFPLNFADLASKGKIYFDSKFIFATTNLLSIDSEAKVVIQEPEAVARRLNFPYTVRVKGEYCRPDGKLDYHKFQKEVARCRGAELPLDAFPWYVWEAAKHDFITGFSEDNWVTMREVITLVSADLRQRAESFTVAKDSLREFVEAYGKAAAKEAARQSGVKLAENIPQDDMEEDGVILPVASAEAIDRILAGGRVRDIFGVDADASEAAINAAYRKLSALVHPDKCPGSKRAVRAMQRLNDIMDRVSDARAERQKFNSEMKRNIIDLELCAALVEAALMTFAYAIGFSLLFNVIGAVLNYFWTLLTSFIGGKEKVKETSTQSNRPHTGQSKGPQKKEVFFQSMDSTVCNNVYANTYKMYVTQEDGEFVLGQVTFLIMELALSPAHFTVSLQEMLASTSITLDSRLWFRNSINPDYVFSMSVRKYMAFARYSVADTDVEFIKFEDIRAHRNITASYMKEADMKHLPGYRVRLDICELSKNKQLDLVTSRRIFEVPSVKLGSNLQAAGVKILRFAEYEARTDRGDCGAPLCVADNSSFSGRTAFGIHVAGSTKHGIGYSAIVTQEMILKARDTFKIVDDKFGEDLKNRGVNFQSSSFLPFENKGSFMPIGVLEKPVVICPKTSYYPTDLYGSFGEYDCWPAHMSPVMRDGVRIYPMENAVKPYASPLYVYEQPWMQQAMHTAMRPLTALIKNMPKRVYTFEEAVKGIPEEKFRSIPRGTAAGFPYTYEVRNGKKEFFGEDGEYDLSGARAKELRERVDLVIDEAKRGVRLSHVFVDFLKDELRSRPKIEAVATRLISSAPLDYVVAWRMLFGAFSSAVMRSHTRSGMSPGICTFTDWDILVSTLRRKGRKCFDGDFKAFDSSEQPSVHRLILEYINDWYDDGEENRRAREVLWMDLTHSRHVGGLGSDQRYLYQWNKSLPSGHPFTTIVNSMYSAFMMVSAYISLTNDYTGYWLHCSFAVYGDDNAVNVDDETADVYNQKTVADVLYKEFYLIYTPGKKDGVYVPYTTLEELTFLKRGFTCRDNTWLCPLDRDSFLYTVYFCKNRKLEKKIIIDVLENALQELSMHPKEAWEEFAPKIFSIMEERGHVPLAAKQQSQYLALISTRSDSWF